MTYSSRRWVVVAMTMTLIAGLAYTGLLASAARPSLGVAADYISGDARVSWVLAAGWAWDAGIRVGDAIVSADGRPVAADEVARVASAARVLVRNAQGDLREAPLVGEPVPDSDLLRWAFLVTAACFLLVGGAVFVLAIDRRPAALMFVHATSGAVLLTAAVATPSGVAWAFALVYVGLVGFGASTLLLCLVLPFDRLGSRAGQRVALATLLSHAVLIGAFGYAIVVNSTTYEVVQKATFVIVSIDLLGGVGLLIEGVRATPASRQARRQALTLLALGMIAGCLPFVLLSLLPHALGLGAIVPAHFAVLSIVLVPTSFGVGILRRQFFGIERIIRRGLVALVVWASLIAAYVLGLQLLSMLIRSRMELFVLAIALTASTFGYLQSRARSALESLLFHDTYIYAHAVEEIAREIVTLQGVETISRHVLERLGRLLDLRWAVLAFEPTQARCGWGAVVEPCEPLVSEPLIADGVPIGALMLGPKDHDVELQPQDHALIRTLAPLVATALQSSAREESLEQQVELLHRREEELVALSNRLMRVQEDDRHHLALDLHDDPLQRAILLARELAEEPSDSRTTRWRGAADEIIASLRAICTGLRPRVLDDLGLEAGLGWLVNDLRARSELDVSLHVGTSDRQPFGRLPADLEIALFRVTQEALANCLRHADAASVTVELCRAGDAVRLLVEDDGVGLRNSQPGGETSTVGLLGMRERLRAWGGSVCVEPLQPRGTRVIAEVESSA